MTEKTWSLNSALLRGFYEEDENSMAAKPAVVVLPGGGYLAISETEGAPVAKWFAQNGFRAFVLEYSTAYESFGQTGEMNPDAVFPGPACDVARALFKIRESCREWSIDPQRIALCGFSAGGHLAAYYGNNWVDLAERLELPARQIKPNASILCYAASDMTRRGGDLDREMLRAITGAITPTPEVLAALTPKLNVNINTPPTFLWHAANDAVVPATDSISLAAALAGEGVRYELHVFDRGVHATGLSEGMPAEIWPGLAAKFMRRYM